MDSGNANVIGTDDFTSSLFNNDFSLFSYCNI